MKKRRRIQCFIDIVHILNKLKTGKQIAHAIIIMLSMLKGVPCRERPPFHFSGLQCILFFLSCFSFLSFNKRLVHVIDTLYTKRHTPYTTHTRRLHINPYKKETRIIHIHIHMYTRVHGSDIYLPHCSTSYCSLLIDTISFCYYYSV